MDELNWRGCGKDKGCVPNQWTMDALGEGVRPVEGK